MSTKIETRPEIKEIEVISAYCDRCGAFITSAETLDDGYNPAYYAGEFNVKIGISTNASLHSEQKTFEACLCKDCTPLVTNKIKDGVRELWSNVLEVKE